MPFFPYTVSAMVTVSREEFEQIVYQKYESLPREILERLDNVELFVEDEPRRRNLWGLYHGVPFPDRKNPGYSLVMPDKIILYRYPIMRSCRTREQLERRIEQVLYHEIGHYLGLDEDELRQMGL